MTTSTQESPAPQTDASGLVVRGLPTIAELFTITDETIASKASYLALKVNGIEDKEGYAKVMKAQQDMVHSRTALDRERKAANQLARDHIAKVDARAKALQAKMDPIEEHLNKQRKLIDDETARRETMRQDAMVTVRQEKLAPFGMPLPDSTLRAMTDDELDIHLMHAEAAYKQKLADEAKRKADQERLDQERAELDRQRLENERLARAEQERLAAERRQQDEELAKQRAADAKKLKEQQDALDAQQRQRDEEAQAERDRLEKIKLDQEAAQLRIAAEQRRLLVHSRRQRLELIRADLAETVTDGLLAHWSDQEFESQLSQFAERERLRKVELEEAAEKARQEAEAKAAREKFEADAAIEAKRIRDEQAAKDAEAARVRMEQLRPDRDKLAAVASAVLLIEVPEVSDAALPAKREIMAILARAVELIQGVAAGVK